MRQRTPLVRMVAPGALLIAGLVLGACQQPAGDPPGEKPAPGEKGTPDQAKADGPSKSVAKAPPDEPAQPKETPRPDEPAQPEEAAKPDDKAAQEPVRDPMESVEEPPAPRSIVATEGETLEKANEVLGKTEGRTAAETVPEVQKPESEEPATEESSAPEVTMGPGAAPPAKETEEDDDEGAFSLKELEENRKLIEQEMAKEAARRAEAQKKRIAELGAPLVDNVDKLKRLDQVFPVWADPQGKRVVLIGEVCQRRVPLEMFACTRSTKEHEAIVVVDSTAQVVHAGLLVMGAKQGKPVQFYPKYQPATGQEIEVTLVWKDAKGKKRTARAQDWIRHVRTKKSMEYPWVFAGSMFRKDEFTGKNCYLADLGDFICVSNFPTAMLDLPVESSSVNQELAYEAFTERIPEEGTPVTIILTPKPGTEPAKPKEPAPKKPSKPPGEKAGPDKPKSDPR